MIFCTRLLNVQCSPQLNLPAYNQYAIVVSLKEIYIFIYLFIYFIYFLFKETIHTWSLAFAHAHTHTAKAIFSLKKRYIPGVGHLRMRTHWWSRVITPLTQQAGRSVS